MPGPELSIHQVLRPRVALLLPVVLVPLPAHKPFKPSRRRAARWQRRNQAQVISEERQEARA